MKKMFQYVASAVVFMACIAACTSEPTLIGKWKSDSFSKDEDKAKMSMAYEMTLNEDNTFQTAVKADMSMIDKDSELKIPFNVSLSGKWSDLGDRIVQIPDSQSVKLEFVKDSLKIKFKDPEMEAVADKLKETMLKAIDEEMKGKLSADFAKADTSAYKLEGNVLKICSENDTVVFNRVVEKK